MRTVLIIAFITILFSACHNSGNQVKTFCDTTCKTDSFKFSGNASFNQSLSIGVKNCKPDTLTWTHGKLLTSRKIQLSDFLNQDIRLNSSAINAVFQDTVCAWLAFNDCMTGRGYLLKLPFSKEKDIQKITGALNGFDPKFSIDKDLRAYTDRGSIYVVNTLTGAEAQMTFKEEYPIDFNDIHKVLDSINVTKSRIYVKLLKNGNEVPFEKPVSL